MVTATQYVRGLVDAYCRGRDSVPCAYSSRRVIDKDEMVRDLEPVARAAGITPLVLREEVERFYGI